MPVIYAVCQFGEDGGYHTSLTEAMKDARQSADHHKVEVEVVKYTLPPITLKTFVAALNQTGWAAEGSRESAAMVYPRGRRR